MKTNVPHIRGTIEISINEDDVFGQGVFIGGDSEGLRSLAELCEWLAEVDQKNALKLSHEVREHIHLRPNVHLSHGSFPAELCRLDAKQE